jgi:hypothetical protein
VWHGRRSKALLSFIKLVNVLLAKHHAKRGEHEVKGGRVDLTASAAQRAIVEMIQMAFGTEA